MPQIRTTDRISNNAQRGVDIRVVSLLLSHVIIISDYGSHTMSDDAADLQSYRSPKKTADRTPTGRVPKLQVSYCCGAAFFGFAAGRLFSICGFTVSLTGVVFSTLKVAPAGTR